MINWTLSDQVKTEAFFSGYTSQVISSPPAWVYNCGFGCTNQIIPENTVKVVDATSATPLFTPKDLYPTRTTGATGHMMGWVRINKVEPATGPFASFDVGGTHYDLKLNANGAVTKNDVVWIAGVGQLSKTWVHIAVVLDSGAESYIRVATPSGAVVTSIPALMLDSTTDIAKLGGTGTTHVQVRTI